MINANNYSEILTGRGFEIIGTGGGCTGWAKTFPAGHYVLITNGNLGHDLGETIPGEMGICVCAYDADSQALPDHLHYWEGDFSGLDSAINEMCDIAKSFGVQALDIEQTLANALDSAVLTIQKALGVRTGDFAGIYFSGNIGDDIKTTLRHYLRSELNHL